MSSQQGTSVLTHIQYAKETVFDRIEDLWHDFNTWIKKPHGNFYPQCINEFKIWMGWHDYVSITINEFHILTVRKYTWYEQERETFDIRIAGFNVYSKHMNWNGEEVEGVGTGVEEKEEATSDTPAS